MRCSTSIVVRNALRWCLGLLLASIAAGTAAAAEPMVSNTYDAYRFTAGENWRTWASGPGGATRLDGTKWTLDFSQGAQAVSLALPDRSLPGRIERFRLRVRGSAKGHPVQLLVHTHFMTFRKRVDGLSGAGEQELVIDAPPGPGWEWFGGENDGKLHGPLRLGEIRVEANGLTDRCELELVSVTVDAVCPGQRRCIMTAQTLAEGDRIEFVAEIRAMADTVLQGTLRWQTRDWTGRELGRGEKPVTVPARCEKLAARIPAPGVPAGCKFVETEFTLDIPGQEVPAAQAYWLARRQAPGDSVLRPESPFGMGLYLNRYRGPEMERAAAMARDAGVKWSREDFHWGQIEPEKGRFDWSFHDNLVACAKRNGITVYAIVAGWPSWSKAYTEEGADQYAVFLQELIRHYKGEIRQWEIWNEPNIFFWQGPRELYASLLIKSYAAAKQADPTAEILGLSTAGIDYNFIQQMLAKKTPFDILTIHPYRKVLDDQAFIDDLKRVSDLVKLPDGRRRPVWLTEMGWATHTPHNALGQDFQPNTLRVQAEMIARSYLCSIVSGVEPRTFWYDFRNDGDDPVYFEHTMGIVYRDFSPKPAYQAFATLTEVLKEKRFDGPVPAPQGTFAFRFRPERPDGDAVIALWNPTGDAVVTLEVAAPRATLVNTIGERSRIEAAAVLGGKPTVEVRLTKAAPVYVVVPVREPRSAP
ncbi:MAG: endo-1,4-beta-xylanase [Pirellulales bacterium]